MDLSGLFVLENVFNAFLIVLLYVGIAFLLFVIYSFVSSMIENYEKRRIAKLTMKKMEECIIKAKIDTLEQLNELLKNAGFTVESQVVDLDEEDLDVEYFDDEE